MSALIHQKIQEARLLLSESQKEETEGAVIAQKIADLKLESERLFKSAREKKVIGNSQLDASEALAKEYAIAAGELVESPAAPVAKKRGGRPKAAQPEPAPVATAAVAAKGKGKTKGKTAKDVIVAKDPKADAKPVKSKEEAKSKEPKAKAVRTAGEKGPPLHEKIKIVMGPKEMTIAEVIEGLRAHDKSWVPKSRDLSAYISLVLSTHLTDHFDRVKRGVYKVKKGAGAVASASTPATPPPPKPATPPNGPGVAKTKGKREKAEKENGSSNGHATSNGLAELGTNVLESPFSGAEAAA